MLGEEFERQVATLLRLGYARISGLSDAAVRDLLLPLQVRLPELDAAVADADIPFVIVLDSQLAPPEECMPLVEHEGRPGLVDMNPTEPGAFTAVDEAAPPPSSRAYFVYGDTGRDTLNVTPHDAMPLITAQGRSPLTIQEGIGVLTHVPDVLRSMNAFSLLGSRRGDKRVPALWLSKGRPRLGWCWAGNPHPWLGSASCAGRLAA